MEQTVRTGPAVYGPGPAPALPTSRRRHARRARREPGANVEQHLHLRSGLQSRLRQRSGATTLSIMTLSIMTLSAMTLSKMG